MPRSSSAIAHRVLGTAALVLVLAQAGPAVALPMYALASARTCGNCHISPTFEDPAGWNNPDLSERKCNLSCSGCHVNPTGGGLRNSSGRYFGQSTLAMIPLQERSYSDYGRELLPASLVAELRGFFGGFKPQPSATSRPANEDGEPAPGAQTIPSSWSDVERGVGAGNDGGWAQFGDPLFSPSTYGYWDGRYGDLAADPLLAFGADARLAYWSGNSSFFPMQLDLHAAVHPVEHITGMVTLAGRGRANGATPMEQEQTPFFLRNAFVMVHELPYMGYAKAGIFLPPFGTHLDDHTSFIRKYFDMDVSTSDDTVIGVEVGLAPNYPYLSAAIFRGFAPYGAPEGTSGGAGGAINFGWRALGWTLSAHGMQKRRDLAAGGDLDAVGVAWGLAPGYWIEALPLSLAGEFSFGRRKDPVLGRGVEFYALYSELWWSVFNGVNVRAKYDLARRDLSLPPEHEQRLSFALDLALLPGVTLIPQVRFLFPAESTAARSDIFVQAHFWF